MRLPGDLAGIPLIILFLAAPLPTPHGYVNDFAGVLDSAATQHLEDRLRDYERETTNEIAIAILPSLKGSSINEVATRLFESWKIGKRGTENGVLVVAAIAERSVRIEVGYGLEGKVPDAQAGRIIREAIVPNFRAGRYAEGLEGTVDELVRLIGTATVAPPPPRSRERTPSGVDYLVVAVLVASLVAFIRSLRTRCPRCNTVMIRRVSGPALIGTQTVDYVCPKCGYREHGMATRMIGPVMPWYGGRGWGSGGLFASGGGGFSGFGGGLSGGGGASGSW